MKLYFDQSEKTMTVESSRYVLEPNFNLDIAQWNAQTMTPDCSYVSIASPSLPFNKKQLLTKGSADCSYASIANPTSPFT